jgi:hypothetical protein
VTAVRVLRPLLALAAVVALAAGCTGTVSGTGRPDAAVSAPPSRSAAPSRSASAPVPTHNGVASMSGDEALGTAYDALRHADSVRMKGVIRSRADGWSFDLRYRGTDATGALVLSGLTLHVRKVGRWVYRKAGREFWRRSVSPATAERLQGRWVETRASDKTVSDLVDLLQLDRMADSVLSMPGTLSTGVFRKVNGVETVPVSSDGPDKQTVYVAIVGEPYPVRVETVAVHATVDLVEYDRPVRIEAPPRSEVVRFARPPGA